MREGFGRWRRQPEGAEGSGGCKPLVPAIKGFYLHLLDHGARPSLQVVAAAVEGKPLADHGDLWGTKGEAQRGGGGGGGLHRNIQWRSRFEGGGKGWGGR